MTARLRVSRRLAAPFHVVRVRSVIIIVTGFSVASGPGRTSILGSGWVVRPTPQRVAAPPLRGSARAWTIAEHGGGQRLSCWRGRSASSLAGWVARADLIYFRGGGDAQLPATVEGNRVVLGLPDGQLELYSARTSSSGVPGFWPAEEWDSRRREARGAGFAARYAAAWWAIENGLTAEAAAEVRELHALDPKHGPTARMAAVLDRLDRPCPDPEFAAFRRRWGSSSRSRAGRTCSCSTSIPTPRPRSGWPSWSG